MSDDTLTAWLCLWKSRYPTMDHSDKKLKIGRWVESEIRHDFLVDTKGFLTNTTVLDALGKTGGDSKHSSLARVECGGHTVHKGAYIYCSRLRVLRKEPTAEWDKSIVVWAMGQCATLLPDDEQAMALIEAKKAHLDGHLNSKAMDALVPSDFSYSFKHDRGWLVSRARHALGGCAKADAGAFVAIANVGELIGMRKAMDYLDKRGEELLGV